MTSLAEPIDRLHVECLQAQMLVRTDFGLARSRVAKWEPGPCPANWGLPPERRAEPMEIPYLDSLRTWRRPFRRGRP